MRVEKKIVTEMVKSIEWHLKGLTEHVINSLEKIQSASSVEEIMRYKQDILLDWMDWLPIDSDTCYFCNLAKNSIIKGCNDCLYAKHHKVCYLKDSDYAALRDIYEYFRYNIAQRYYKGEKYIKTNKGGES